MTGTPTSFAVLQGITLQIDGIGSLGIGVPDIPKMIPGLVKALSYI